MTPAGSPYSPSDSPPASGPVSPGRPRFPGFPAGETVASSSVELDMVTAEPRGSGPSRSPSPAPSVEPSGLGNEIAWSVSNLPRSGSLVTGHRVIAHDHRVSRSPDIGHFPPGISLGTEA